MMITMDKSVSPNFIKTTLSSLSMGIIFALIDPLFNERLNIFSGAFSMSNVSLVATTLFFGFIFGVVNNRFSSFYKVLLNGLICSIGTALFIFCLIWRGLHWFYFIGYFGLITLPLIGGYFAYITSLLAGIEIDSSEYFLNRVVFNIPRKRILTGLKIGFISYLILFILGFLQFLQDESIMLFLAGAYLGGGLKWQS